MNYDYLPFVFLALLGITVFGPMVYQWSKSRKRGKEYPPFCQGSGGRTDMKKPPLAPTQEDRREAHSDYPKVYQWKGRIAERDA